jgi:flagellar protein FliS
MPVAEGHGWQGVVIMSQDISSYVEHQVAAATPGELIEMLYARAVRDLKGAHELFGLEAEPRAQSDAIHLIVHAQQIIAELHRSLDFRNGGDLVRNLARLYEYMQYRLTEAVSTRDDAPVVEVADLLAELHEAWKSMVAEQRTGSVVARFSAGILVA